MCSGVAGISRASNLPKKTLLPHQESCVEFGLFTAKQYGTMREMCVDQSLQ